MRLLLTRPRADSEALARRLEALGHGTAVEPVLTIEPLPLPEPDLAGVQALAATSRHAVAALAAATPRRDLPLYAVGAATAAAARAAGFPLVESADGDAAALAALLRRRLDPARGAVLHAAGETLAADLGQLLAGSELICRRMVLYRSREAPALSPATLALLRTEGLDAAAFLSPRSASGFVRLAESGGVVDSLRRLVAYCLSPAVAAALAPSVWAAVRTAARPDLESLLATIGPADGKFESKG